MLRPLLLIFLSTIVALPHYAAAQFTSVAPLTLTVSPLYPAPYSTVTITPHSTVIDLAASTIATSVNGKVVANTTGSQPIMVQVGAGGTATTIKVTATVSGTAYTKEITIRPASVALIVEPISTAHPFYKGGLLVAPEGRLRLIAVPDLYTSSGVKIPANTLVYSWKFGDQVLQEQSGIGRSQLSATAPVRYRDADIRVTVTDQGNTVAAQATFTISPAEALVRVYRTDPLLGPLFNAALSGTYTMNSGEESFRAVPYFFTTTPSFAWSVSGGAGGSVRDLTVRTNGNGSGTAAVSITTRDSVHGQNATNSFSVSYGNQSASTGLFGL